VTIRRWGDSTVRVAFMLGLAIILLACESTPRTAPNSEQHHLTLRYGAGTPGAAALPELGVELGYFTQEDLTLDVNDTLGANVQNALVSGQVDIIGFSLSGAEDLAHKGKATTIVMGLLGSGLAGALVGSPTITSLSALKGKAGHCTIATMPNGNTYGYATLYDQVLNLHCSIVQFGSADLIAAAVVAGRVDVAINAQSVFQAALDQGKVHLLIDPKDSATRKQYFGENFVEIGYFGLTDVFRKNRDCLLYTSPSPRDLSTSRMPSSA